MLVKFIGHLLSRRGIRKLYNLHLVVPGQPYLAGSHCLHEFQGYDGFVDMRHEIFVALHCFVERVLVDHNLI